MGKIEKRTIIEHVYIGERGEATPISKLTAPHLVNAFAKAAREVDMDIPVKKDESVFHVLKDEIIKRITNTHESE